MAKAQQTFAEMLAEMDALKQRISNEADSRVREIKEELDSIAEAKGVSIGQLLGLPEVRGGNNKDVQLASGDDDRAAKDARAKLVAEIKSKYDGRTALANAEYKSTQDYEIGAKKRGAIPNWVVDAYTSGNLKKYLSDAEDAPSIVTPKDDKAG